MDRYFVMNLNEETKERVLDNVKELMKVTDWHYFDPQSVVNLDSKNPQ